LSLEPIKIVVEEPSSPLPDDPRGRVQPPSDLRVRHPGRGVKDDPRALHILEGQLLRPRPPRQLNTLRFDELDAVLSRPSHRDT
jgi:hypothetical protein